MTATPTPIGLPTRRAVLVTGAGGYLGRMVVQALAADRRELTTIVATDLRVPEARDQLAGVVYERLDVCDDDLAERLKAHAIDTVVHLAAIVTPPPGATRELLHSVDVGGTRNIVDACVAAGATKLIVTSSGAAYGYHADNAALLTEDDPIRGHAAFAYADHKRQVEELLADAREAHPELTQLVLRPGTILGRSTRNQITALWSGRVVIGLRGVASPFVFVWDEDVAACIVERGVHGDGVGVYNLAGDGVMTLREVASELGKRFVGIPVPLITTGLGVLKRLNIGPYGPEQVCFLRYRPVLSNHRLKHELGFTPRKTTREVLALHREGLGSPPRAAA